MSYIVQVFEVLVTKRILTKFQYLKKKSNNKGSKQWPFWT